ncbi:MAG: preprotein translocase subunit SecE [Rhodococcus sp. (in: high G+C Gram-positive bacteria)]
MTEERGKRDDQSEDLSPPDSSTPDASSTESSSGKSDSAGASPAAAARPSGKRTARRSRTAGEPTEKVSISKPATARTSVATRAEKSREPKRPNVFKRLIQFLREVIAELRKVIWPNRKQMVTYTSVVLVFVTFMVAYISGMDLAFTQGIEWVFG